MQVQVPKHWLIQLGGVGFRGELELTQAFMGSKKMRCLRWKGFSLQALSWVFWKITRTFCPKFITHITLSSFCIKGTNRRRQRYPRQPTGGSGVITCSGSGEDAFAGSRGRGRSNGSKSWKNVISLMVVPGRPGTRAPLNVVDFFKCKLT